MPAEARRFERRIDALIEIAAFVAGFLERQDLGRDIRPAVDFAVEELFTNMVMSGAGGYPTVDIELATIPGGVVVTLVDRGVAPFDVTQAPDADLSQPLERRAPGGLGLHLTRRLVDSIEYQYSPQLRESRITFRKTGGPPAA